MRQVLKEFLYIIFKLFALPLFLLHILESLIIGKKNSFQGMSQLISLLPGYFGIYFRSAFYCFAMKKFHRSAVIEFGTTFSNHDSCIGKNVVTGSNSNIGFVKIGDNCLIGGLSSILSGKQQHFFNDVNIPIKKQGGKFAKIEIGNDCYIGNGCIIMSPIGNKCIIGAGSVVTKDIEDYSIVAGNPARIIKNRLEEKL